MKGTLKLELKYGILISVFSLIWLVFEQLLGIQDEYIEWHSIVSSFSLIIPIVGIWLALREFKMARVSKYTFQKGFNIGVKITLINSILVIPIIYIFYTFINPDWTSNMMMEAKKNALNNGEDITKAMEEARTYFGFKYYLIQSIIGTLIFGTLMSSVIAFLQKNRGKAKNSWS
jgi:hypothetical protein